MRSNNGWQVNSCTNTGQYLIHGLIKIIFVIWNIFKADKYRSYYRMTRSRYFDVARDQPKTNVFVPNELRKLPSDYKTRRFICRSCLEEFFPAKTGKQTD